MKIHLKLNAMSILMAELEETQMRAIYLMKFGTYMPSAVTKSDLVKIIAFLLKQLDWIDDVEVPGEPATYVTKVDKVVKNEFLNNETNLQGPFSKVAPENGEYCQENPSADNIDEDDLFEVTEHGIKDEEDDTEPPSPAKTDTLVKSELQKSNLAPIAKTLEVFSEDWETCEESLPSNTLDKDPLLEVDENKIIKRSSDEKKSIKNAEVNEVKCSTGQEGNFTRNRVITDSKKFSCSKCDYKCNRSSSLKVHERTHTGEKPFRCSTCKKGFLQSSGLKNHERIHTGDRPFSCSTCDYKCIYLKDLKGHERTHTGEKPFSCSMCDYKCTRSSTLKIHKRTHTGEKPFSCTKCDYKCTQLGSLKAHHKNHHEERIQNCDKPYRCSLCNKRFALPSTLKIHERIHTGDKPYSCSKCDKKFFQKVNLEKHETTHTSDKPFSCSICDYRSNFKHALKVHERKHTGKKAFSCSHCEYKCNQSRDLKRHNEKYHAAKDPISC